MFLLVSIPSFIQGIKVTLTVSKLGELELLENVRHINQERQLSGILCYDIKYMLYSLMSI